MLKRRMAGRDIMGKTPMLVLFFLLATAAQADLIGHWKLDETSGTSAVDSSTNANNGTLRGGDTFTDLTTAGQVGTAVDLDGTNDFVDADNSAMPIGDASFSISLWFKADNFTSGPFLFGYGWEVGGGFPRGIKIVNSTTIMQYHQSAVYDMSFTVPAMTADGATWYHLITTYEAAGGRLYLNNVESSTGLTNASTLVISLFSSTVHIGESMLGGTNFNGVIDDVGTWDTVLTGTQRTNVYLNGVENFDGSPAATAGTLYGGR